ncbi:MAG: lysylphosphatidylglycerol synthase domain-containing protein [Pseudomonadota bacterium]
MISKRTALAIAVSGGLLVLVLYVADIGAIDLSQIQPAYLPLAVLAYLAVLVLRATLLRHLAQGATDLRFRTWLALAARHQFVFTLAPSGSGDLAFPVLANRMVGVTLGQGTALIAGSRLRDICAILGLGFIGLSATGAAPILMVEAAVLCGFALYFSDVTGAFIAQLLRRDVSDAPPPGRALAALLTCLIWLSASGAIAAAFAAAGHPLTHYETFVMLAGLNIAGALAVSIGGLGIAEAGAAGVLAFLGMPLAEAAAIALVARPILLLTNVAASGLTELCLRATPR